MAAFTTIQARQSSSQLNRGSPNRKSWGQYNPRQVSFSPPSFNRHEQARSSFGPLTGERIIHGNDESSIMLMASPNIQRVNQYVVGIPVPQKQLDMATKLKNVKSYIYYILNLLPQLRTDELRLKLTGAFERLDQCSDEFEQSEMLMSVFSNFVSDIASKLHLYLQEGEVSGDPSRSYAV